MASLKKIDGEIVGTLTSFDTLTGELTNILALTGELTDLHTLVGKLTPGTFTENISKYTGVYTVTPTVDLDTILETTNRKLEGNIIVNKIPYFETTNESGGYTVTIG